MMLKEEKLFRLRLKKLCGIANCDPKPLLHDLTGILRAVREECANVADNAVADKSMVVCQQCGEDIAAAIRNRAAKRR